MWLLFSRNELTCTQNFFRFKTKQKKCNNCQKYFDEKNFNENEFASKSQVKRLLQVFCWIWIEEAQICSKMKFSRNFKTNELFFFFSTLQFLVYFGEFFKMYFEKKFRVSNSKSEKNEGDCSFGWVKRLSLKQKSEGSKFSFFWKLISFNLFSFPLSGSLMHLSRNQEVLQKQHFWWF